MKLVSTKELEDLKAKAEGQKVKTPKVKLLEDNKALKKELALLKLDHKETVDGLVKNFQRQTEKASQRHSQAIEDLTHKQTLELTKHKNDLDKLSAEVKVLAGLNKDSTTNLKEKLALDLREEIVKVKEENFKGIAKALAEADEKAELTREEGFKKGYADGLADGLREATKITAEDRKMAMQIAAIAASSHTPDAATEIAKKMLGDVTNALPQGKKSKG